MFSKTQENIGPFCPILLDESLISLSLENIHY